MAKRRLTTTEKNLILLWCLFGVMAIGAIGALIKTVSDRTKGTPLNSAVIFDEHIPFDADPGIGEAVQDNYLKYLNMAYILIGDYPDCEMIKISA